MSRELDKLARIDDWQRVRRLSIPGHAAPAYKAPNTEKILRVQNDYFTAAAVFRRKDGLWGVTQCAPILNWMRRTPFDCLKKELLKRGCSWEWLPVAPDDMATRVRQPIGNAPVLPPSNNNTSKLEFAVPASVVG